MIINNSCSGRLVSRDRCWQTISNVPKLFSIDKLIAVMRGVIKINEEGVGGDSTTQEEKRQKGEIDRQREIVKRE